MVDYVYRRVVGIYHTYFFYSLQSRCFICIIHIFEAGTVFYSRVVELRITARFYAERAYRRVEHLQFMYAGWNGGTSFHLYLCVQLRVI